MPTAARNIYVQCCTCIMEMWLGDHYDIQGMDTLSGLISKLIDTCNIGVGARGWGCSGQADPE